MNQTSESKRSSERHKDYVTNLAIWLFVFILVFELLLVTWLPQKLITEKIWDKDVALAELIDLEDTLRNNIEGAIKFENKWQKGEAYMVLDCLNEVAKYLREYHAKMSRSQIRELYTTLQKFEKRYYQWSENKYCITFNHIDIEPLLQRELDKYNNDRDKKRKTEEDNILFQE